MTFVGPVVINDANPGPALWASIDTVLIAQGWTLVDTVTISTRTHKIYKSAAAGNSRNLDWFLDISYPTTGITGGMYIMPFEFYDPATDLGYGGIQAGSSSTTVDQTTFRRYGATGYSLEHSNWMNNTAWTGIDIPLSATSFSYWMSVTRDRLILFTTVEAGFFHYAGFFTPTSAHASHAGAQLFPLIVAHLGPTLAGTASSSSASPVGFTRAPRVPTGGAFNWFDCGGVGGNIYQMLSGQIGVAPSWVTGGYEILSDIPVFIGSGSPSAAQTNSGLAGFLDGIALGWVSTSAVRGDTVTVGSDTWYLISPSQSGTALVKGV